MSILTPSDSIKYYISIYLILLLFTSSPTLAFQAESGDLLAELKNIDYGDKDENSWKQPSPDTQFAFGQVMDLFLEEDFSAADALAITIGYEIVEFSNAASKPTKTYYILREVNPLPSTLFTGGGTFVLNPGGANLAIQAPHPISDFFTSTQAIEIFLSTQSRLLFLAGTRRDNSTELSQCSNGSYRKSDVSHYTEQLFYLAHTRASDADAGLVFVQLHGFGTSSLSNLQNQCGSSNDKLINLSEGVNYSSDPSANTFMQILNRKINDGGIIEACVYGNQTSSLGATWTTTGRYSNQSVDPCFTNASVSSEHFVHIEQSYRVRSNYRPTMTSYISATIKDYFKSTGSGGKNNDRKKTPD